MTAISTQDQVERSARSFVHSERMTRAWVTGPATAGLAGAGPARVAAFIASLRRGTRRCPGVTCMNASSSEALAGVSSNTGRCACHAPCRSARRSAPDTRRTSVPSLVHGDVRGRAARRRSRPASGVRTSTSPAAGAADEILDAGRRR